jgi:hypothetical protein
MQQTAGRQSTPRWTERTLGQHLSLSVAAHLARTQLTADPLATEDARRLSDQLNKVALALARTAPLYLTDTAGGPPRELTAAELEGAVAQRSGTRLVLRDGRVVVGVTIRQTDLRQAIAILRAVGLGDAAPARQAEPAAPNGAAALLARAAELDTLIDAPGEVERAKNAALWIARNTAHGRIANLAMQLMSALHEQPGGDACRAMLARLRHALNEV